MTDNETDTRTWFELSSLNSQMAYVIACAIADRQQSAAYWTERFQESGSEASLKLAEDAVRCHAIMKKIQKSMARGEIVCERIIPSVTSDDNYERRSWDARTDMG